MIRIPRSRLDLTVTYARVIASLARVFNDIAEPVLDALRREFHGMMKTKNQGIVDTPLMIEPMQILDVLQSPHLAILLFTHRFGLLFTYPPLDLPIIFS